MQEESSHSNTGVYSVFSLLLCFYIVFNVFPFTQTDPKTLIAATVFGSSILVVILQWTRPEERIPRLMIRRYLKKNEELFGFAIRLEILFKGWEKSHLALAYNWQQRLYDLVLSKLPANPAFVPTSVTGRAFYLLVIVPPVIWDFFIGDLFIVFFSLVFGIVFGVFYILLGVLEIRQFFLYLVEFRILEEHLKNSKTIKKSERIIPLGVIEYRDPRIKTGEKKQEIPMTSARIEYETLEELHLKLREMLSERNYSRFAESCYLLENLLRIYSEKVIPSQYHEDLIIVWSSVFSNLNIQKKSLHQLDRLFEAYLYYYHYNKDGLVIPNKETFMKDCDDLLGFFQAIDLSRIGYDGSKAVSDLVERMLDGRDIRSGEILEILLAKSKEYLLYLKEDYVRYTCKKLAGYSDKELKFIFAGFIEVVSEKLDLNQSLNLLKQGLEKDLEDDKLSNLLKELVKRNIDNKSEPRFDNEDWKAYRLDFDETADSIEPVFESLLKSVELLEIEQSTNILEFLLHHLPLNLWNIAGEQATILVLSAHKGNPSKETEEAIVNILSSSNTKIKLETLFRLSDSDYHTTTRLMETVVDCLFEHDEKLRIAAAITLAKSANKLDKSSQYYQKIKYAMHDSCPKVIESIQTIIE